MKKHQRTIGKNDEWLTPPEIISKLGFFDLDPATCDEAWKNSYYFENNEPLIKEGWSLLGLELTWFGRVWLNPPFNRYERPKWMAKMAEHNNGIMLVPAACETEPFFNHVWGKASGILFLKGRPHFHYRDGSRAKANSGCTICLISYGAENARVLRDSKIPGKFISLIPQEPQVKSAEIKSAEYLMKKGDLHDVKAPRGRIIKAISLDTAIHIAEVYASQFKSEPTEELKEKIETLRLQLAACGVAAQCNTAESAKHTRVYKGDKYYSYSYQDVCNAVDREMSLHKEVYELKQEIERLKKELKEAAERIPSNSLRSQRKEGNNE